MANKYFKVKHGIEVPRIVNSSDFLTLSASDVTISGNFKVVGTPVVWFYEHLSNRWWSELYCGDIRMNIDYSGNAAITINRSQGIALPGIGFYLGWGTGGNGQAGYTGFKIQHGGAAAETALYLSCSKGSPQFIAQSGDIIFSSSVGSNIVVSGNLKFNTDMRIYSPQDDVISFINPLANKHVGLQLESSTAVFCRLYDNGTYRDTHSTVRGGTFQESGGYWQIASGKMGVSSILGYECIGFYLGNYTDSFDVGLQWHSTGSMVVSNCASVSPQLRDLYARNFIVPSGSVIADRIHASGSDLILSSSAGSIIALSGTLKFPDGTTMDTAATGGEVTGSGDFFVDNALSVSGSIAFNNAGSEDFNMSVNNGILTASLAGASILRLPQVNNRYSPTIQFGDGDSGFYESGDDVIRVSLAATINYTFQNSGFATAAGNGAYMINETPSSTNPVWSFWADDDTGVGRAGVNQLSLIAQGVEILRLSSGSIAEATSGHLILSSSAGSNIVVSGTVGTQEWTVATVSTGSYKAGQLAYVSDGDGGSPCLAMYDGADWKVISLGATIAAA